MRTVTTHHTVKPEVGAHMQALGQAQPEPALGLPPAPVSCRDRCLVARVALKVEALDDPGLEPAPRYRVMECHLAVGEELEPVWEVERYWLDIIGLTSKHSLSHENPAP